MMSMKVGIFDLDGVITDTAKTHFKAWKGMFDEFLEHHASENKQPFIPFSEDDYLCYLDGKPRIDGIQSFLSARHIALPLGTKEDKSTQQTVHGLAQKKQALFLRIINQGGFCVFESTLVFIKQLHKHNIKTAVVSSSKNCQLLLQTAGIENLFETRVDGLTLEELGLSGKPKPDMFLEAARRCHTKPQDAFIVEDALSGVEAGKAGKFGLVIGIDRKGTMEESLRAHGADVVVRDMSDIKLEDVIAKTG